MDRLFLTFLLVTAAGAGDTVSVDVLSGDAVDFAFNSGLGILRLHLQF